MQQSRILTILSIAGKTHKPNGYTFWPSILGIEMWRHGTPHAIVKIWHYLGLSMCIATNLRNVDVIASEATSDILSWKNSIEVQI